MITRSVPNGKRSGSPCSPSRGSGSSPRSGGVRLSRVWMVLAVTVSILATLPAAAPGQDNTGPQTATRVLVGNANQTAGSDLATATGRGRFAQQFGTGDHADGYFLSSVEVGLNAGSGVNALVTVKADDSGEPGRKLAALSRVSSLDSDTSTLELFRATDVWLEPGTSYWIEVQKTAGADNGLSVATTTSENGVDNSSKTGWSIGDNIWAYSSSWQNYSTSADVNMKIRLRGTGAATTRHAFADEFSTSTQGNLTDDDQTNNWDYMWRENYNFDSVSTTRACSLCTDMPSILTPPIRALRWLVNHQGWQWHGASIDLTRAWQPAFDKRLVIRWTSTYDSSVDVAITGDVTLLSRGGRVGSVGVTMYGGDHELVPRTTFSGASSPQSVRRADVTVHPGDELYFILDSDGTDSNDSATDRARWDPVVTVLRTITTVHDSALEYRNEQANLANNVHSDDWLYEYKFSITDRTPQGNNDLPVSWAADAADLFRLEVFWDDPQYNSIPDDIHSHDITSELWGIGFLTRQWSGVGHNLHVGPTWMQPTHGMDAVKTWVNTYPTSKEVKLVGAIRMGAQGGAVRLLVITSDSSTGESRVLWDTALSGMNSTADYDVLTTLNPGDRVHFIAHQTNNLNRGFQAGRTHTNVNTLAWTPSVEIVRDSLSTPTAPTTTTSIVYPPSISHGPITYRTLVDNQVVIANKGMGMHHGIYDNFLQHYGGGTPPSDTLDYTEGIDVVYIRIPWSFIQQEDNKIVWARIDEILDYWGLKGKRAGFRFTSYEQEHQAAPLYIKALGARGEFRNITWGQVWIPRNEDTIFQREYRQLLEEFAQRYGDDPRVDYMELGAFGQWGEGHNSAGLTTEPVLAIWANMFVDVFDNTEIALLWPDDIHKTHIAVNHSFGIYDDSIGFSLLGAKQAEQVWRNDAIRLETTHFFENRLATLVSPHPYFLVHMVEGYHASHFYPHGFPDRTWAWYSDALKAVSRRLGFRFNFTEAFWSTKSPRGEISWFDLRMRNAGIAPNYLGGHVGIIVSNGNQRVETLYRGFNTADLAVASSPHVRGGYTDAEVTRLRIPVQIPKDFPTGMADVSVFVRKPHDLSIRGRNDRPLPVVGDWLDYPWEYYELPLANRVEHEPNAFSYVIGQIEIEATGQSQHVAPTVSPVTLHRFNDEYGTVQGILTDRDTTNDWLYRTANVPAGNYAPLAGTATAMVFSSDDWARQGNNYPSIGRHSGSGQYSYPQIGSHRINPDTNHDAVLTWQNTRTSQVEVIVSGILTRSSGGNGTRVSLVKTASGTNSVIWGPITINDSDPVPFSVVASLGAQDQVSLVFNSIGNRANDRVNIENLMIAVSGPSALVPISEWDVFYTATEKNDVMDDDYLRDWVSRRRDRTSRQFYELVWLYRLGWTVATDNVMRVGNSPDLSSDSSFPSQTYLMRPTDSNDAVLTWKNSRSQDVPVIVSGRLIKETGGDGVNVSLFANDSMNDKIWHRSLTTDDPLEFTAATLVDAGDTLSLMIDKGESTATSASDGVLVEIFVAVYEEFAEHLHIYSEEFSTTQGDITDSDATNDWNYRQAVVDTTASNYTPLAGTMTDLTYSTETRRRCWGNSGCGNNRDANYPIISIDDDARHMHPSVNRDAVLTWTNTRATTSSFLGGTVSVSGAAALLGACADGNGVRFSIVKNSAAILLGPLDISTDVPVPFEVSTNLEQNDTISFVLNAKFDAALGDRARWCDGLWLEGLAIHRYPLS